MNSEAQSLVGPRNDLLAQYERIAEVACARLAKNERVRRNLPAEGRLRVDRQLPFLVVYRSPPDRDDAGTVQLVTTEAAYLFASGANEHHAGVSLLCRKLSMLMQEHFGTFLLLEIWTRPENSGLLRFEIASPSLGDISSTIAAFQAALSEIRINRRTPQISACERDASPPGLHPLDLGTSTAQLAGCCIVRLIVDPVYRDSGSDILFPIVLHRLRHQLAVAIRRSVAQFTGATKDSGTGQVDPVAFHSLGPSSLVKAARLVDHQLSDVSESFDFLLQVTPTNADETRQAFIASGYHRLPRFIYRPLPYRPSLLKRQLFDIEIERIEDPTLANLFWEKQDEIARKLTAIHDLDTEKFLYSSLQLYGDVDDSLLKLSKDILEKIPEAPVEMSSVSGRPRIGAKELIALARDEVDYYHTRMSEFNATIELSDGIAAGIMVSQDRLLVSESLNITEERVAPLLHHEIGTHLLTYFNGRCQPFRQLYAGLSGCEELQEGLAVLAEYLAGGLTANRVRTLAGRVIAVKAMLDGAAFAETFRMLHEDFGFSQQRALTTTIRVYRGGGLTKDVIYLRGLRDLVEYLAAGHDIEPLYVGKIALRHVPYVQEMRRRKIIVAPRILPRFWEEDTIRERLEACRKISILDVLEPQL